MSITCKKETIYSLMLRSLESLKTINHHYLLKENVTNSFDRAQITEVKNIP